MRALLGLVVVLSACGSGLEVTDLACQTPCQADENPFLLHLQATYKDPAGELPTSHLVVRAGSVRLDDIPLTGIATGSFVGTLKFDVQLPLPKLIEGSVITVGIKAQTSAGVVTDEVALAFKMSL